MPSTSKKQEKFMRAAAHNKRFAAKAGIDQEVAKEFSAADQAKKKKESVKDKMAKRYGKHKKK